MNVAIDANVLIDMFERREPHYLPSAQVLSRVSSGKLVGVLAGHTVPNIYYVLRKICNRAIAEDAVDWMLRTFGVVAPTIEIMRDARKLPMTDFEDAIIAESARVNRCDYVVTRDLKDFLHSPVPAVSPANLLHLLGT